MLLALVIYLYLLGCCLSLRYAINAKPEDTSTDSFLKALAIATWPISFPLAMLVLALGRR